MGEKVNLAPIRFLGCGSSDATFENCTATSNNHHSPNGPLVSSTRQQSQLDKSIQWSLKKYDITKDLLPKAFPRAFKQQSAAARNQMQQVEPVTPKSRLKAPDTPQRLLTTNPFCSAYNNAAVSRCQWDCRSGSDDLARCRNCEAQLLCTSVFCMDLFFSTHFLLIVE